MNRPKNSLNDDKRREVQSMDVDSFTVFLFRWLKENLNTDSMDYRRDFCGIQNLGRGLFPVRGGSRHDISDEDHFKLSEAIAYLERRRLLVRVFDRPEKTFVKEEHVICLTSIGVNSDVDDAVLLLVDKPEETVAALEQKIGGLDDVVRQYYLESLRAYQEKLYFSSVICLGAASERAVHWLTEAIEANWGQYQTTIRKKRDGSIAKLIEHLINDVIPYVFSHDKHFVRELLKCLKNLADVYRENRNEAGHPKTLDQGWTNEDQEILLVHFRRFITAITKAVRKSGTTPTI